MTEFKASSHLLQLAHDARQLAAGNADSGLARQLREDANKYDRKARQLSGKETLEMSQTREGSNWLTKFLRREK